MPFLIGQCCVDQVLQPDSSGSGSGLNEKVPFTNVPTYRLMWNATRKARFGLAGVFQVWIKDAGGVARPTMIQAIPDNLASPSYYDFDFGGPSDGEIIIT